MKRLRRLPRAIRDIDEIWSNIFLDNPRAADAVATRLIEATNRLSQFPESGSPKFEIAPGLRSIPVGRYTIYYRIAGQWIDILRIVHSARDVASVSFD